MDPQLINTREMASKYMVNFSGTNIEVTVTDKGTEVDDWVRKIQSMYSGRQIIVGLDCEWKPHIIREMSNRTATLQLCVDTECIIIQMFYIDSFPQSFTSFLRDPNVTFVGVEVGDDVLKLQNEYGLSSSSTADIQALAMARWPFKFYRKPGLKKLASDVVGLCMPKPRHICQSNWEARVLDAEQVEYACIDAFASYRIGYKLLKEV